MTLSDLPAINATLNGLSAILLVAGWQAIHTGNKVRHRNCMIAALVTSAVFLVCYLTYHTLMARTQGRAHTVFADPAWFRPIYLTLLGTHLLGAIGMLPLIFMSFNRAFRERFDAHRRIARWTLPIWFYVSVTGVVIYLLLYQVFPQKH